MHMNRMVIAAMLAALGPGCAIQGDAELESAGGPNDRGGDDGEDRGDDLGDDVGECEEDCKDLCADADNVPECVTKCIDEHCEGPWQKTTPICNYLDRGLLDHRAQVLDRYVVFQPGVKRLSDLGVLRFGLDLPDSYCEDNPHGTPCSDRSYDHRWLIDSVDLSVLGIPLFHDERELGEAFLMAARAGSGNAGISGYDSSELRSNPLWGFSFNELRQLFQDVVMDEAGEIAFDPATIKVAAPQVASLLEGMIGRALAARRKGCVNSLYCDDVRGKQIFWAASPDCDFGGCPLTTARKPSPWLELRGTDDGTMLQLDIDLDVRKGTADLTDCDGLGSPDCGTEYADRGRFSARVDLAFTCAETGDGKFSIAVSAPSVDIQPETGLIADFPGIAADKIAKEFDAGLFDTELARNLPACPSGQPVVVTADGGITIQLDGSVECDEGVSCIQHRVYTGGGAYRAEGAPARRAPATRAAAIAPWTAAPPSGSEIVAAMEAQHGVPFDDIPITATHTALLGETDDDAKIPMSTLDAAVPLLCAMAKACTADIDFAGITVPPPLENIEKITECDDPTGDPDSDACQAYLQMRAFVQQPAVLDGCIQPVFDTLCEGEEPDPECAGDYEDNDKYDQAMKTWLLAVGLNHADCKDKAKPLEAYIPIPFIDLTIRTGRENVTNGFAFVDLQEPENVMPSEYAEYECRHRPDQGLIPDPYEYPRCSGQPGDLGCECKDIDIFKAEDVLADLGFADGAGSHLAHGVNGTGQACDDSTSSSDAPVVCGSLESGGHPWPVCMECGVDTNIGCPCEVDADCGGVEADLSCSGSEDKGWGRSGGGTCLPDPDVGDNKERLTEMPWFCMDNCDSIDSSDDGMTACVYNQLAGFDFAHGTCVDFLGSCEVEDIGSLPGQCEEQGMHCFVEDDQCRPECEKSEDCGALGFPDWFACDMDGVAKCVPSFCAGPALPGVGSYCALFF